MKIYDYLDRQQEIEVRDGINFIVITVVTGDETGIIHYNDGTIQAFDASDSRVIDFFDGTYFVSEENVDKFIGFTPDESSAICASYQRQLKFT